MPENNQTKALAHSKMARSTTPIESNEMQPTIESAKASTTTTTTTSTPKTTIKMTTTTVRPTVAVSTQKSTTTTTTTTKAKRFESRNDMAQSPMYASASKVTPKGRRITAKGDTISGRDLFYFLLHVHKMCGCKKADS